ncbi:phosphomannomutase/phosphoglucomutase [Brachybacterium sp. J144]|uniref:phosphomannomutase/phosphoglucomutase n=1 Tax=Brachybacterium sp. J144 TaxID=3116487 RepID=UPI002E782FE3|nr:phosphomannomutase/phosphoglucomutase [Brachybacterium sp. J144]MEE1649597.1 phosphomannomutase/phosphoglucomutase [Brachybacterium sp. J144]
MTEVQHSAADLSAIVKAYDVRGVAGEQLTVEVARALGAAFADFLSGDSMIVAHDMRVSSPDLARAVIEGAVRRGAIVADAGLSSTDQLYCASGLHRAAGLMITASHNPPADNGMKLCLPGARPISRATGLDTIRRAAEAYLEAGEIPEHGEGRAEDLSTLEDYARTLRGLVPLTGRRPLRVVIDAASAMAGHTAPAVLGDLPSLEILPLHFTLDGTFPHHPADPLDPANLEDLRQAVRRERADLGLAFDGDADRCVVVDETGTPVPPSAITALIAQREIARARAAGEERPVVLANLVSSRHVAEAVRAAGGEVLRSPVGHSLIKALMAEHGAVFGGEHSAHYYFRDFFSADSGMLAALHVLAALEEVDGPASALVAAYSPYAASGEINVRHEDPAGARDRVEQELGADPAVEADHLDGLTLTRWDDGAPAEERWWLSLRSSNTEPLLRLNVEAATPQTLERVRDTVLGLLDQHPGDAPDQEAPMADTPLRETAPADGAGFDTGHAAPLPDGPSGADVPGWVRARLRCPDCGGELRDVEAALQCADCHRVHAVEGGIPVLIAGRAEAPNTR